MIMKILLLIYNFLLIFVTLILAPVGYFIMRKKNKHQHYFERFGFIRINDFSCKDSIWFHCASVGEVRSIEKIVTYFRENYPQYAIIVTTMTATGRQVAYDYIKADKSFLLPLENPNAFSKIISTMNTACLIIVDTELWPNLIYTASSKIPVFLINGRISNKTYKSYKRMRFIFKDILNRFSAVMTKSMQDEERFIHLMGNSSKVITAGNIKFQERRKKEDVKIIESLKGYKFFLVASTHETEENTILSYFNGELLGFDKIVIVPRHIERAESIKTLALKYNYSVGLFSENDFEKDVIICDAFGLLEGLYILANKIFIGGSLINIGGHNIYEALQFEKEVAVGKFMFSFQEIYNKALEYNVAYEINNKDDFMGFINNNNHNDFSRFFQDIDKANKDTISIITETISTVLHKKEQL